MPSASILLRANVLAPPIRAIRAPPLGIKLVL
jgi:hypothetical protein